MKNDVIDLEKNLKENSEKPLNTCLSSFLFTSWLANIYEGKNLHVRLHISASSFIPPTVLTQEISTRPPLQSLACL